VDDVSEARTDVNEPNTGAGVMELGHIVLYVRSLQRSVRFYRDVLGWRQLELPAASFPAAMFSGGRTHHELLLIEVGEQAAPIPAGRRVGLYHFGLKVGDTDDELREVLARLLDANVPIVGTADHAMTHSLYITDPDGNEIELYIDVAGVDWNDPEVLMSPPRPLRL
jgi:catechol 2,3-dioxygenase